MDISFFLKGLIIGFSIAAPVGPIGVLCIRRTLAQGRLSGFVSGLGAATADAIYGCIAGLGLTFISSLLIHQQLGLRLIGGGFLCYLGIKAFTSLSTEQAAKVTESSLLSAYVSTFFLTLTNPLTMLSFAAVFAGLGIANTSANYLLAIILVLGVFTGSALWWLLLCGCIGLVLTKVTAKRLQWVNRISGIIITMFGVVALLSLKT
jgi:threonine/homoserine/homoserine lactone efflux protein